MCNRRLRTLHIWGNIQSNNKQSIYVRSNIYKRLSTIIHENKPHRDFCCEFYRDDLHNQKPSWGTPSTKKNFLKSNLKDKKIPCIGYTEESSEKRKNEWKMNYIYVYALTRDLHILICQFCFCCHMIDFSCDFKKKAELLYKAEIAEINSRKTQLTSTFNYIWKKRNRSGTLLKFPYNW